MFSAPRGGGRFRASETRVVLVVPVRCGGRPQRCGTAGGGGEVRVLARRHCRPSEPLYGAWLRACYTQRRYIARTYWLSSSVLTRHGHLACHTYVRSVWPSVLLAAVSDKGGSRDRSILEKAPLSRRSTEHTRSYVQPLQKDAPHPSYTLTSSYARPTLYVALVLSLSRPARRSPLAARELGFRYKLTYR